MNLCIIDDVLNISKFIFWKTSNRKNVQYISLIYRSLRYLKYKFGLGDISRYLYRYVCYLEEYSKNQEKYLERLDNILILEKYHNLEFCSIFDSISDQNCTLMLSISEDDPGEIILPRNLIYINIELDHEVFLNLSNCQKIVYLNIPNMDNLVVKNELNRLKYVCVETIPKVIYKNRNLRHLECLGGLEISTKIYFPNLLYLSLKYLPFINDQFLEKVFHCPKTLKVLKLSLISKFNTEIDRLVCNSRLKTLILQKVSVKNLIDSPENLKIIKISN